ncbi:MAG: hypothetical protein II232_02305, partial [Spirochaetaceae bacterium]|nr:hypothetical protein [Spirochaetaceae bacterium]
MRNSKVSISKLGFIFLIMLSSLFFVGCKEVAGYDNFGVDFFFFCLFGGIVVVAAPVIFFLPGGYGGGVSVFIYGVLVIILAYIFENPNKPFLYVFIALIISTLVYYINISFHKSNYKIKEDQVDNIILTIVGCCILVAVTYIYKLTQNGKEVFALTFAASIPVAVALIASRKIDKRFIPLSFLSLPVIGLTVLQTHRGIPTNIYLISLMLCVVPFCIVFSDYDEHGNWRTKHIYEYAPDSYNKETLKYIEKRVIAYRNEDIQSVIESYEEAAYLLDLE